MNDKTARSLLRYIGFNHMTKSRFLTTQPLITVEVTGLIAKIAELRGIDIDVNAKEFSDIIEEIEVEVE